MRTVMEIIIKTRRRGKEKKEEKAFDYDLLMSLFIKKVFMNIGRRRTLLESVFFQDPD